jgi:Family of unknown function (DUF5681)
VPENESQIEIGVKSTPAGNRYQTGQSGNPAGRPRGSYGSIKNCMKKAFLAEGKNGQTVLEEIIGGLIEAARGGDRNAAAQLLVIAIKLEPDDQPIDVE